MMSNEGRGRGRGFGGRRGGGLIGAAVSGIAGGIGLASESISAHRAKKKAQKEEASAASESTQRDFLASGSNTEVAYEESTHGTYELDATERQWELDETQSELLTTESETSSSPSPVQDDADLATKFASNHPLPSQLDQTSLSRLELPVILAQRRPKDRTRGFIRGYAPVLENVGIDQTTWLEFLDTFDKSIQSSPWIQAINLAGLTGSLVPLGASIAISVAITMTIKMVADAQTKQRSNKFLTRMNQEFFNPRGVHCLIMTWRPESDQAHESVDMTSTIASSMTSYSSGVKAKFKGSSGKTYGDFSLPDAAPLVFPTLDVLQTTDNKEAEGLKEKMKRKADFVGDYYDRRAQMKYAHKNPDNMLANQQEKPTFTSRYADPTHPSNNGSLISLVTGGYVDPSRFAGGSQGESSGGRGGHIGGGGFERLGGGRGGGGLGRGGLGGRQPFVPISPANVAKNFLFKRDVLYLMVVDMPTEEELEQARSYMRE